MPLSKFSWGQITQRYESDFKRKERSQHFSKRYIRPSRRCYLRRLRVRYFGPSKQTSSQNSLVAEIRQIRPGNTDRQQKRLDAAVSLEQETDRRTFILGRA
jgi:hypothetical protein